MKKVLLLLTLTLLLASCGSSSKSDNNQTDTNTNTNTNTNRTIYIMPLGNSITYEFHTQDVNKPRPVDERTSYRDDLYYLLKDNNIHNFDFVGSQSSGCNYFPDCENEGHPGWTPEDIAKKVYNFLAQNPADFILLHIGTNSPKSGYSAFWTNEILNEIDRYEVASGRAIKVFVALIINRENYDHRIPVFNAELNEYLQNRTEDDIVVVDMQNILVPGEDYDDNTHPNDSGYAKMALKWYEAIQPFMTTKPEEPQEEPEESNESEEEQPEEVDPFGR
jgi:hypothetical protein